MQTSELPDISTGPPAWVQIGLSATKFFSSTRVTNTAVVMPFLGNVAAVVAPIARSEAMRFLPATVSAFASAGTATPDGEADGVGVALGVEVGVAEAVALGEGEGEGDADGVDFATGFAGAFLTGAFFTGFLTTFFAGGFLAARARSPSAIAESTPASIEMNFRRPVNFG